jgi:hypothetical protein
VELEEVRVEADGGWGAGLTGRHPRKRGLMVGAWTGGGRWVREARGTRAEPVGVPARPDGGRRHQAMTRSSHIPDGSAVRLDEDAPSDCFSSSKMMPSQ